MDYTVPRIVAYLVAWFSFTGGMWALFERAETVLQKEAKQELGEWSRNQLQTIQDWPSAFTRAFDAVFGNRHLSWKCFLRSCLASLAAVLISTLMIVAVTSESWPLDLSGVGRFAGMALLFNGIADYASLLETRYFVSLMSRRRPLARSALLLGDIVLTFLIYNISTFLIASVLITVLDGITSPEDYIFIARATLSFIWEYTVFWKDFPSSGFDSARSLFYLPTILLYSTFFTSVWLWLFYLSYALSKAASTLGGIFDFANKPLRSLGFIAVIISTIGFTLFPLLL